METPLQTARRERAFQRSRLRVLRRYRARLVDSGGDAAGVDAQLAELELVVAEADARVRALRAETPRS